MWIKRERINYLPGQAWGNPDLLNNYCVSAIAAFKGEEELKPANRWMISPEINLTGVEKPTLYWSARSYINGKLASGYKIILSTSSGTTPESFDVELYGTIEEKPQCVNRHVDLTPYIVKQ